MTKEAIAKSPSGRVTRTSIAVRNKLTVNGKDPNYVYRIVNDDDDRVAQFLDAGYETVPAKSVKIGDKRVDASGPEGSIAQMSVGGGQKAVVLRIRKDWYEQDQAAKQANVDDLEKATKAQALNGNYGKLDLSRD
jgi:hypothetical protein